MPELSFSIQDVEVVALAVTPRLAFKLCVTDIAADAATCIHSIQLRVQIRIEPTRRDYRMTNAVGLSDLFGQPERWGATMRSMLWTHASVLIPGFEGITTVDLPIECTYDFNIAATKYFSALDDGDIPLCFLFSGTYFYQSEQGLQAAQISWEREASFRLPVSIWREMMARYYPNCAWLCLDKDVFGRLFEFKSRSGLPSWEQAIERLLAEAADRVPIEG